MNKSKIIKKEEEYYDDSWMYIMILATAAILTESLKSYTFNIGKVALTYSIFLLPFLYLITNYITKKFGYKKSVVAISISGLAVVLFITVITVALGKELVLTNISGEFCGYIISQFVNLTIYSFLLNNTKEYFMLTAANYLFSLIIFYMFYTLIYLNIIVLDNFWIGYILTIIIQSVICLLLAYIDKHIKRGKEKTN